MVSSLSFYSIIAIISGILIVLFRKQVAGYIIVWPTLKPLWSKEERKKWFEAGKKRKGAWGPFYSIRVEDIYGKKSAEQIALAFGIISVLVGVSILIYDFYILK